MTSTHLTTSDISIIIPTLNEEDNITHLPKALKEKVGEILIIDGGSQDKTVKIAKEKGFEVVVASPGRASQLNIGANCCRGSVLLFLHADTQLPHDFETSVIEALNIKDVTVGAFSLAIRNSTPSLTFIAHCANLRSRHLQLPYGDQALFLTKRHFLQLGQFPLLPILEDYTFIKKAKKHGKIHTLPQKVTTSSRRWERLGVVRTTLTNQIILCGHALHISPERLASFYRR